MAVSGTAALSNEVKTLYDADFYMQTQNMVYFDQFCDLKMQMNGQRGLTYEFPIVESGVPQTGVLNELEDVVPQQMRVNAATVTLQEFGGAIEVTKFVSATAYADVHEQAAYVNGYNVAESLDFVVRAVAGQGSLFFRQNDRAARADFTGKDTPADRLTSVFLQRLHTFARATKMPFYDDGSLCSVIHPFLLIDLLQDADMKTLATRQVPELLFNGEVAYFGGVRLIVSPSAKAFWGQGAVRSATSYVTTLAAPVNPGDTNLKVTAVANLAVGEYVNIIDAAEPGNTWSDTNEVARVTAVGTLGAGGTGIDVVFLDPGPGDAGGARYAHSSGTVINDDSSVYPIPLLGPNSIIKVASDLTGPYGETVVTGPFDRLGRFLTFGWYAILGYNRARNVWLLRGECSSSEA